MFRSHFGRVDLWPSENSLPAGRGRIPVGEEAMPIPRVVLTLREKEMRGCRQPTTRRNENGRAATREEDSIAGAALEEGPSANAHSSVSPELVSHPEPE